MPANVDSPFHMRLGHGLWLNMLITRGQVPGSCRQLMEVHDRLILAAS